jgi:hypothetical protein
MAHYVRRTSELDRILSLPRRVEHPAQFAARITPRMTALLKRVGGTMSLRDTQGLALHDFGICRGGFDPIGVGEGKTLISLLAPHIVNARRPLLVLPAGLIHKTFKPGGDHDVLAPHWQIPKNIQSISYELLGRVQKAGFLLDSDNRPDLLVFDEAHRLKNRRAAVTRRVSRYMDEYPDTMVLALSGTIMKRSLLDFGHVLRWCLKGNSPLPRTWNELEEWALAIDDKVNEWSRVEPGALLALATPEEKRDLEPIVAARRGFQRRLTETPGVVATVGDGEKVDCSLNIRALKYELKNTPEKYWRDLREAMVTPDGWELSEAVDVWRHAKELALGLFYAWSPRPPPEWRRARKEWAAFVRDTLSHSRTLDSELQVANACDAGKLDPTSLNNWRRIKPTFVPNVVPVWCDDSALNVCMGWMKKGPGIVWTEHSLFAQRLAELSGCRYFGARGFAADGMFIDDANPPECIIASIYANREGRNLQEKWSRNLITSMPEGADVNQQLIGRTHRPGQTADEVDVDILLGCREHANAFRRAMAGAQAIKDTTGADSKLLLTSPDWPDDDEIASYRGARWGLEQTA